MRVVRLLNISALLMIAGSAIAADAVRFSALFQREGSAAKVLERYQKMEELRKGAQEALERLMAQRRTPDLELRYGELILQRARDLEQFGLELEIAGQGKRAGELRALSKQLLNQGLKHHMQLLTRAKNLPIAPKVYLAMARTEQNLRRFSAALQDAELGLDAMRRLKVESPETELHLLIAKGDAAFDSSKAALALQAYNKARALTHTKRESFELAYLTYRLGWVHFNLKDPDTAVKELDELFALSADKLALRQEAVQDYALFAADLSPARIEQMGGPKGVYTHLSPLAENAAVDKAMQRWGSTLAQSGRRREAIEIYRFLIANDPMAPAGVDRALQVIQWSQDLADKAELTTRYHWLIRDFGPHSVWYGAQAANATLQKNASDRVEAVLREYALRLHQESLKNGGSGDFLEKRENVIAELYDTHIRNFPEPARADAARIHYYRAEIHRRRAQWQASGERYDNYLRLVQLVPKNEWEQIDQRLHEEAAWGSVQVWAKAVETQPSLALEMLRAADRFVSLFPKRKEAPQVALDAAKIELASGNTPLALKRMGEVVTLFPRSSEASKAVHAQLDLLNKEKDWVNLALRARESLNKIDSWAAPHEKTSMRQELSKILAQTEVQACKTLSEDKQRLLEAAMCFRRYAEGFAQDAEAPRALLRASEIFDDVKDTLAAAESLELLVKKYPHTDAAEGGFSRLATSYERSFQFAQAASIYEMLMQRKESKLDRQKVLTRLLGLYESMKESAKLEKWLKDGRTPASQREEFAKRRTEREFAQLREEEQRHGYGDGGLASEKGRALYQQFWKRMGALPLHQALELRRMKARLAFNDGKLDEGDKECQAGLKEFWKASKKSDADWEAGARLRLEQARFWELSFEKMDFMKAPEKKAGVFKKLDDWYAEVAKMRAPVVALESLWASARLTMRFAEEIEEAPVPAEFMAANMEAQRKAYQQLIKERVKPLKQKSSALIKEIAVRAKEWKVLSPVVLAALKETANLRAGIRLPGRALAVSEESVLQFPWPALPRWLDLSAEEAAWQEWLLEDDEIEKIVADKETRSRARQRRAAFVALARKPSLKQAYVGAWAETFASKAGIQLRVQAMVNDADYGRAELFLDQYDSLFSADAFSEHMWGQMDWRRGEFARAYLRWIHPNSALAQNDFRTQYWQEGWLALLDEMIEGMPTPSRKLASTRRLAPLARLSWHKHAIALLCLKGQVACEGDYAHAQLGRLLMQPSEASLARAFSDGASGWSLRKDALAAWVAWQVFRSEDYSQLDVARKALSEIWAMQSLGPRVAEYDSLKRQADLKQEQIDLKTQSRALASNKNAGSETAKEAKQKTGKTVKEKEQ